MTRAIIRLTDRFRAVYFDIRARFACRRDAANSPYRWLMRPVENAHVALNNNRRCINDRRSRSLSGARSGAARY